MSEVAGLIASEERYIQSQVELMERIRRRRASGLWQDPGAKLKESSDRGRRNMLKAIQAKKNRNQMQ